MKLFKNLYGGRLSRTAYFCYLFSLGIFGAFVQQFYDPLAQEITIASVLMIPFILLALAVWVCRFHDTGLSGYWAILAVIPYVNFIAMVFLLFAPGQHGKNKYGPPPGQLYF